MAYREYYAPGTFRPASQPSTDAPDNRPSGNWQEYYGPSRAPVTTEFQGAPFKTGVEPEFCNNLNGLSGPIVTIAFSPDGASIVAGSKAGELRIWSLVKPGFGRDLNGHTDMVAAVTYSFKGDLLASGSADNTVRVWKAVIGQSHQTLTGHTSTVTAVAFSSDGKHVLSGSEDRTIRTWDLSTGSCRTLSGQKPQLAAVTFSRTSGLAALSSCGANPSLRLFDLIEPRYRFLPNLGAVAHAVAFSPDGKTVAAGLANNTVQYWDIATDELTVLIGHQAPVFAITCAVGDKLLISGSADGTVRIWNKANPPDHLVIALEAKVWAVSYSPDGKILAVGLGNGKVRLFGLERSKETTTTSKMKGSMKKLFSWNV